MINDLLELKNLDQFYPTGVTEEQKAKIQTMFYKKMSLVMHEFYQGKMQTIPKAPVFGFNWFNVWYTPGVSSVSTAVRDAYDRSFSMSNRSNLVAVVSDSTRVLGDGDCGIAGGLGVMEGKAFLMKYLAGIDAQALCINNRDKEGNPQADKVIDFVKMLEPSFGAVNLEDISQPNCYRVLDECREACDIPVWHDDAQGTACVIIAGLINALKLAEKEIDKVTIVLMGAGASNSTVARLLMLSGADPERIMLFDHLGGLHTERQDFKNDPAFYIQWELCQKSNPRKLDSIEEGLKGADVLIALSQPGPDTVKPHWIRQMNEKAIVFTCANPVPEIYPYAAKEAGAFIAATGRGDFPNQVNNSLGFPGILKGALLTRSRKITDNMALSAARSMALFAEKRGFSPDKILPLMTDLEVFAQEAADVAMQSIADGVARIHLTWEEVYQQTMNDIRQTHQHIDLLVQNGLIRTPDSKIIEKILKQCILQVVQ